MSSVIAKKEKTYKAPILAILFILIGTGLLIFSFKELNAYTQKNNNYTSTEAHVIKHTYKNGKVSSVILEYTVGDNKYTIYSSSKSDCIKSYGSVVDVKYNPSNPEDVIFANRSINILIPVAALVLLSIGLSIIIVMLSDNVKKIKRYSKIIIDKNKKARNNINLYNNFNNINQTNNMINDDNTNDNTLIDEKAVEEIRELKTEHKKVIKEEKKDEEIIKIPSAPSESSNPFDNVNYIDFISEVSDNNNDTPDFIPNMDEFEEKLSSKENEEQS